MLVGPLLELIELASDEEVEFNPNVGVEPKVEEPNKELPEEKAEVPANPNDVDDKVDPY